MSISLGMLSKSIQPALLSLFSSTNSDPLALASTSASTTLETDSFVSLLNDNDDSDELIVAHNGASGSHRDLKGKGRAVERGNLGCRVLHLQAPDCRGTYVAWGSKEGGLGITAPFLSLSIKNLGQMMYFEIGIADDQGKLALVRVSTFQSQPKSYPATPSKPPLLHLPLRFPPSSDHLLTPWSTITLHIPTLLNSFTISTAETRLGRFRSVAFVKIHANCRLRRVWFSDDGTVVDGAMAVRGMRTELALFAHDENETA